MNEVEVTQLIVTTVISSIIGSSGLVGLFFWKLKKEFTRRLDEKEARAARREQRRIRQKQLETDLRRADGRVTFWLYKTVNDSSHNEDLEKAFEEYEQAEKALKDFENQVLAEVNSETV